MNEPVKSKGRGCWFYGCIISLILAVVVVVGGYLTVRYVVRSMIARYTDDAPMALPTVELPPGEMEALQKRFESFRDAVKDGKPVPPLTLTSDEINALLGHGNEDLKGRFHVALDGDQVKGQISLPLDDLGIGMLKGRYLNGSGVFKVSLENGVLLVRAESLEVKGRQLPEQFMSEIRKENLAEGATRDAETAATIQKLNSIQVTNSSVVIQGAATE